MKNKKLLATEIAVDSGEENNRRWRQQQESSESGSQENRDQSKEFVGVNHDHYSFEPEVMPSEFREHLEYVAAKINRQWKKWRSYEKVNISDCDQATPECAMSRELGGQWRNPFRKCCVEHKLLRDTAFWTIDRLKAHNITYFLSTGTALGAVRHRGTIIPWDTDVDIAVFPSSQSEIIRAFQDNGEHYFEKDSLGKDMFWVHASKNGKPRGGPHVEIFFDEVYTQYPEDLLPLEGCPFYGREVACPNRKMFDVWFPSGWKRYGGGHYHGPNRCTLYIKGKRIEKTHC